MIEKSTAHSDIDVILEHVEGLTAIPFSWNDQNKYRLREMLIELSQKPNNLPEEKDRINFFITNIQRYLDDEQRSALFLYYDMVPNEFMKWASNHGFKWNVKEGQWENGIVIYTEIQLYNLYKSENNGK